MSFFFGMVAMYLNAAAIAFFRERSRAKRWNTTFNTKAELKEALTWIRWFS